MVEERRIVIGIKILKILKSINRKLKIKRRKKKNCKKRKKKNWKNRKN
jgi:tetrahydromethanopterin S-methyltransferase subunit E